MKEMHSLGGLIIILFLIGPSLQDNTTAATAATPAETTAAAADGTPAPPGAGSAPEAGASPDGGGKCKPDEVFTDTGCVLKGVFMSKVMVGSWKDEGFQKVKQFVGVVDTPLCKAHEVLTAYGCADGRYSRMGQYKVPVHHSSLDQGHVVNTNFGSKYGYILPNENEEATKKIRRYKGPPISGHNRPRKNYILPGRRLRTWRLCLPYEVLRKDGTCVRKEGKKGLYEHRDHVYGLQQRHRQKANPNSDNGAHPNSESNPNLQAQANSEKY